jgi:5'-AMP-activated protein kinase regulatory gamma subunit
MSGVDTPGDASPGLNFVTPRSLLEQPKNPRPAPPVTAVDREQIEGLRTIRAFLKARTSYDVLPISYRLIVLDTALLVKKSLNILNQNG